jgi:hypothetical protein
MNSFVLDEILRVTKDNKSLRFWKKAIRILGEQVVESELGEVRYQIHKGNIENAGAYLTQLLKKRMSGTVSSKEKKPKEKLTSYLAPSQLDLFKELKPQHSGKGEGQDQKAMTVPTRPMQFPGRPLPAQIFLPFPPINQRATKLSRDSEPSTARFKRSLCFADSFSLGILNEEF